MKKFILLLIIFISVIGYGQKQKKILIESHEQIIETAIKELDQAMQSPEGSLYLFKKEHNIEGTYKFDISVHEKGAVASVFVSESEGGTIQMQNSLKDFIKDFEFNFKCPKGKKYKFQYVFKFN